jgi:CDP-4-dehydro-6-deoxyglucose reductase, E3
LPTVSLNSGKSFQSSGDISILDAALKSDIRLPYSCKTGRCGTCRCRVTRGITKLLCDEFGLTDEEKANNWILGCARCAATDLALEVEDLGSLAIPPARVIPCRISVLERLSNDSLKVVVRLPPNERLDFIGGQYVSVIGPGGIRRSYSVANAPRQDNTLEFHIRLLTDGVMSHYWAKEARLNDLLRLHGPLGTFFLRDVAARDLIFLATGTGFAPVKAMLETLPGLSEHQQPRSVMLVWGARSETDLYFDVNAISCVQRYIPVLSRGDLSWRGERGYVQDVFLRWAPDLHNSVIYACGSDAMIRGVKSAVLQAGLPVQRFFSDAFLSSNHSIDK